MYGVTLERRKGVTTILNTAEESAVVEWVKKLQQLGHPITQSALRIKVAEICQFRETPFVNGIPGKGWLRCWKRQHPDLTFRVAQGLEVSRARGLCSENVASFYNNLQKLLDSWMYSHDRLWNCDEIGAIAGKGGGAMVVAEKGIRSVHQVTPDQREWLSVLVCVNASGDYIPSFYVFKGKRFRKNYIEKCEPGATMAMQP